MHFVSYNLVLVLQTRSAFVSRTAKYFMLRYCRPVMRCRRRQLSSMSRCSNKPESLYEFWPLKYMKMKKNGPCDALLTMGTWQVTRVARANGPVATLMSRGARSEDPDWRQPRTPIRFTRRISVLTRSMVVFVVRGLSSPGIIWVKLSTTRHANIANRRRRTNQNENHRLHSDILWSVAQRNYMGLLGL